MEEGIVRCHTSPNIKRGAPMTTDAHPLEAALQYASVAPAPAPFAGRLGGNQRFILDRTAPQNEHVLRAAPDAALFMAWRDQMELRPFRSLGLWKRAVTEGVGELCNLSGRRA